MNLEYNCNYKKGEIIMNVLQSRRFWTFLVAQLVSIATFVFGHYVVIDPAVQTIVITTVEGLAAFLIGAYTVDDTATNVAAIKAGTHPDFPPVVTPPTPPPAV
jgi:hypothetical protein